MTNKHTPETPHNYDRLLIDAITDYAIYMLDPDGRVSNWNPGAQRFKGYKPEEIIGQNFSRFYTPEDQAAGLPRQFLDISARTGSFEGEGWRVRKDGSRFWAHVVIDAIHDETGKLIGFAKITRDITEKMKTQQALEQTREALFHSQKTEAIGRLTGGIAHDFNNLLMVIIGSLRLLQRRVPNDPKILTLVDNALQGAERGTVLIKRMLAFARRQDLKQEVIDLAVLVDGMTNLLTHSLGSTISIATKFPPHLPSVIADANQVETALLNLMVNARDAMPNGGEIVVSAEVRQIAADQPGSFKPGTYVCLSVSDTGEGMDDDTLRRATEPFFTTKGVGKGTGLGLSMVQGLAEQSGGQFVIKSQKGKGTTAELWLPAGDAAQLQEASKSPAPDLIQTPPLTILVVDDDPLVLQNITNMLEELGHTVVPATAAIKAYDILHSRDDIDLVITDQIMPDITGIQFGKMIQAKWPQLPIILATGYAEISDHAQLRFTRLAKPFTQEDLGKAIGEAHPRSD